MKTSLSRLFRVFSGLLSALALLLTIAAVAAGAAIFAAVQGESVAVLRFLAEGAGRLVAGQTTQSISIDLDADPAAGHLAGTATLDVRSTAGPRKTFYFLLNPGLAIHSVQVRDDTGRPLAADAYRLLLATAVELDTAIPGGRSVRITIEYGGTPALEPLGGDAASFRADRILLGPETFWYPYDAQSFFAVDATVRLPSDLEVVHNGVSASRVVRGATQEVAWRSERPVAGLALVAGPFTRTERNVGDVAWRVFQGRNGGLDSSSMIDSLAAAHEVFVDQFGASGYTRQTVFVDNEVRRAFNDGSGVMATPPRYFRNGDEGFHLLAHELAHVWWGGTVSERWLSPGTGGQFLVEGLATVSAALATEARYGQAGLERVRRENFFDPNRQGVIEQMSFLDNALSINTTRDTIYRKGGYVGLLLRTVVGPEAFARGLRDFAASHRFEQATLQDLQRSMEKAAGRDLSAFFDEWMRTAELPDLALEQTSDGRLEVTNLGRLPVAEALEIGHVDSDGTLTTSTAHVGATVDAPAPGGYLVLDPALVWPDMHRANNRFPRLESPASSAGDRNGLLTVTGTGLPWDRSTAVLVAESGERRQTWDFPLGIIGTPVWSGDGTRAVVELARAEGKDNDLVILETDGGRRTVGSGTAPAFDSRGHLLAASDGRIIRIADGETTTVIADEGWELSRPQPSPTGRWLAYRAYDGARMQLRVREEDTGRDVTLYAGERDVMLSLWARDESALYATVGSGSRWQVVRLPLVPASPSVLARDIASIADLELSPGGTMLALAAASAPAYPDPRHLLYTIDLESQQVKEIDVDGGDVRDVTWSGAETIVATVRQVPPAGHPRVPSKRALWRVDAGEGTFTPLAW